MITLDQMVFQNHFPNPLSVFSIGERENVVSLSCLYQKNTMLQEELRIFRKTLEEYFYLSTGLTD
ncbi:MAG: hypothetical protein SPL49_08815 [Oribacterium sp.]|nr:hypothetical protein [Oribacterium sp.]